MSPTLKERLSRADNLVGPGICAEARQAIEELEAGLRHCMENRSIECEIDSVKIYELLNNLETT